MPAKKAAEKKSVAAREVKRKRTARFLQKPSCTTCRKARAFMESRGFDLRFRDLGKERLSAAEIEELIGRRVYRAFLNTRNELYRRRNMKEKPPSREEAVRMMADEPNLIRRPVIVCGGRILLGFDEKAIETL
ncbi:MAG: ArsC/Spx/MgsR family protein [Candidatus Acidiferrales bacterium]